MSGAATESAVRVEISPDCALIVLNTGLLPIAVPVETVRVEKTALLAVRSSLTYTISELIINELILSTSKYPVFILILYGGAPGRGPVI